MKVLVPLFASGFFALASAQDQLSFGAPALGQQFTAGDNFIVRLDQHNTSHNVCVLFRCSSHTTVTLLDTQAN